jgi:hypothetical protein
MMMLRVRLSRMAIASRISVATTQDTVHHQRRRFASTKPSRHARMSDTELSTLSP